MNSRFREIVLWLSLGLNAALLVGLALMAMKGQGDGPDSPSEDFFAMRFLVPPPPEGTGMDQPRHLVFRIDGLDLTPEQQEQAEEIFGQARMRMVRDFGHMHDQRVATLRLLIAEPDDEERLERMIEDGEQERTLYSQMLMDQLREFALILDEDQRAKLLTQIERLEQSGPQGQMGRRVVRPQAN